MVTIPTVEYLRLRAIEEEIGDLRSAAEVLDRIGAGAEQLISSEVVVRLLRGEPPLAVWQDYRQNSQSELARQSGVNRNQIIDIEATRKVGSVATLTELAAAFRIYIGDLLVPDGQ